MDSVVKELIVLQVIYALIVPRVEDVDRSREESIGSFSSGNSGIFSGKNGNSTLSMGNSSGSVSSSSSSGLNLSDNRMISSNIKLSLVKLTNEIQNSLLINQLMDISKEAKLNIKDILTIIKDLFPLQRTILVDGQLSFHNLKVKDLKSQIVFKYEEFKRRQCATIEALDDRILELRKVASLDTRNAPHTTPSPTNSTQQQQQHAHSFSSPLLPGSAASSASQRPAQAVNKDPKREKLLQLYRDTVLNKLQAKTKILDKLYLSLNYTEMDKIVYHLIELEKIKKTTPVSVHHLQLILQKSVTDGIMSHPTGDTTWETARQLQLELDDTVQFMRRALE
ncbi:Eaf5p KNAG_0H01600 [Huiozyma naganishii CBS 8797]|uniref:Uncharacterized protein n=1 Tax=Huiozyma naganishii (strain ATCC MYA-139 / BCRC 22969 / CBS 8797 / KCTC 17520 / NBRC 10181 / NCYC 3082 / Yp74L-3) TaxID=1071383 RepID=J7S8J4_HUIN7|nr:hypothetical protein KNAG_0H01600 [Kazachstania naganishii CBS 8797]CCK71574.1 hypothetical protein KNAG_0H01600 [Kazachstania naganishii CBS 8797]